MAPHPTTLDSARAQRPAASGAAGPAVTNGNACAAQDWPDELFSGAAGVVQLEVDGGRRLVVDCARWHGPLQRADRLVLSRCRGPVLDVGCGPGRHLSALAACGVPALGIDASPAAVAAARARGVAVLHASVFEPVPGQGSWGTALLLDGNIGIGGDVARLLGRIAGLLRPGGLVLVETASPLAPAGHARVRVRHHGRPGRWFPWAWTTPAALGRIAGPLGLSVDEVIPVEDRWFAQLRVEAPERGGAAG